MDGNSEVFPVCALNSALESDNHATATELRFEHYQILKNDDQNLMELGHGAMGVTYKALDVQLQRPVALKIINAKFIGDASADSGLFARRELRPVFVIPTSPRRYLTGAPVRYGS